MVCYRVTQSWKWLDHTFKPLAIGESEGLTLNAEKCIFAQGDPDLVTCVLQRPTTRTKKGVQRLLGAMKHSGKYLPCFSSQMEALRSIVWNKTRFECTSADDRERSTKENPDLSFSFGYLWPSLPRKVSIDASAFALRVMLLQHHGAV